MSVTSVVFMVSAIMANECRLSVQDLGAQTVGVAPSLESAWYGMFS